MKNTTLLILITILLSCSFNETLGEKKESICPGSISIRNVLSLNHDEILCQGEVLEIECELRYGVSEDDKNICKMYAKTISEFLNRNSLRGRYYLDYEKVKYTDEGVCIDTFIPGREALDCFDFVKISIPIMKE